MADRKLKDWLKTYMQYTEDTEPARLFQKWTGISVIAGALRKKICLNLGRLRVYPNMYIVFVAEPGRARKSQAIDFGVKIMSNITELVQSADASSMQAVLGDLEAAATDEQMPDGTLFKHSSLNIISREFESFLGQKKENTQMLVMLTDLFDCKEIPWKYHTKNSGSNNIPSPFLNMLAATTPSSVASCFPSSAIGGGLTTRILFIWATQKYKKCSRPVNNKEIQKLEAHLIDDLFVISRMVGNYEFSKDSGERWDNWYNEYEEDNPDRLCKDPTFNGWYSRKPSYILKVAQVCGAAKTSKLIMEWDYIQESIQLIEEIEVDMVNVFRAVGKSEVTSEIDTIFQILNLRKAINEKELLDMTWRDLDSSKFDNVMNTVTRTGRVVKQFIGPKGEGGVWFYNADFYAKLTNEYNEKHKNK